MKSRIISTLVFVLCTAFVGLVAVKPAVSQLIYGNTFPFWNVNGPLTVTGTTTLTGALNASGANSMPITGVTNSGVAATGIVGEVLSGSTTLASAVALTSATPVGTACTSLTAGDWAVQGTSVYSATAAAFSGVTAGINTTALSTTIPTAGGYNRYAMQAVTMTGGSGIAISTPVTKLNLNTTTTYCTVSMATFSGGVASVYGVLNARRMR